MNNKKQQAENILDDYLTGKANSHDQARIESWYNQMPNQYTAPTQSAIENSKEQAWASIQQAPTNKQANKQKYLIAASFIASMLILSYTISRLNSSSPEKTQKSLTSIQPNVAQVNLTLANGSQFNLESMRSGAPIQEAIANPGLRYTYNKNPFQFVDQSIVTPLVWKQADINQIQTSAGGFYKLVLEDGTGIWLNSCSKLLFPNSFEGKSTREVHLTGEAYFEVQHNNKQPFIVKTKNQELQVLGTRFNLQAFDNDPITKTTLLEGAVKIRYKTALKQTELYLQPGQQALIQKDKQIVTALNPRQEIEWTNGNFAFNDESLQSIIRQLERWYNIKVDYSSIPNTSFNGMISKNVSLDKVINLLELTGNIKFKLENDSLRAVLK